MKILWDNYLTDSTVTASSEDLQYPVENLTDKFLERKFQSLAAQSLVTVTFPEDRPVSMIAFGFNNVEQGSGRVLVNTFNAVDVMVNTLGAETVLVNTLSAGYVLKSASGATIESGPLTVNEDDDVSITYLDQTVNCRSVEILFSAPDTLYVGGLAIGDPLVYPDILADTEIIDIIRDDAEQTRGGQLISAQAPMLREWRVGIPHPQMDNDKRLETRRMLRAVGRFQPVFADLWEDTEDEPPIYGWFSDVSGMGRKPYDRTFDFTFALREAR